MGWMCHDAGTELNSIPASRMRQNPLKKIMTSVRNASHAIVTGLGQCGFVNNSINSRVSMVIMRRQATPLPVW